MRPIRRVTPRYAVFIAAIFMLGGCGSGVEAVQDPQTGQTVTCTGPGMSDMDPWSQRDACIADHVAQGWTVKMTNSQE
jgi:hypothetical protein